MDKKILAFGLIAAGNVFGMSEYIDENAGILPPRETVTYDESRKLSRISGINNESYYEIYEIVYDACILSRNTVYDYNMVKVIVEQICKSYNKHAGEFDILHPISLAEHYANLGRDGQERNNVLKFMSIFHDLLDNVCFK